MLQDGIQSVEQLAGAGGVELVSNTEKSLSFIDLFFSGGFLMWPLLLLSIIGVWIFAERWWAIKNASKVDRGFMDQIKQYVYDGKIKYALDLCRSMNNPTAKLIEKGLSRIGRPLNDVQTAVENVGNLEVAKLERGLPMLATIAGGAPMIGFLGTAAGMIQMFFDISGPDQSVDMTVLSSGMSIVLVTTVGGLIVGIMAFFGYNYLVARIKQVIFKMESDTIEFMDLLNEPTA